MGEFSHFIVPPPMITELAPFAGIEEKGKPRRDGPPLRARACSFALLSPLPRKSASSAHSSHATSRTHLASLHACCRTNEPLSVRCLFQSPRSSLSVRPSVRPWPWSSADRVGLDRRRSMQTATFPFRLRVCCAGRTDSSLHLDSVASDVLAPTWGMVQSGLLYEFMVLGSGKRK